MPSPLQVATWQNNVRFMMDPVGFMREILIDSASMLEKSMARNRVNSNALLNNCQTLFEFDLVPVGHLKACLVMRYPGSDYRTGPSIKARFLGFAYKVAGTHQIAHIQAPGDGKPIFTVGITGCTIIGVRNPSGLHFYHEPTRQDQRLQWLNNYPGQMVIHAPSRTGFGTAFMHCSNGKWEVVMQSFAYDQAAWTQAAARDATSTSGTESSSFFNFYSKPTVDVHTEGSQQSLMRTSALSRRAAMGYDD